MSLRKNAVGASNGRGAVAVAVIGGELACVGYAPRSLGYPARRVELNRLFERAAAKLGYRRTKKGWVAP